MVIPAPRLKFYRRANALVSLVDGAKDAPERLVRASLYLWQHHCFPSLAPSRAPWRTCPYIAEQATQDFAQWLAEQPFDEAAYWLASAYALWVGKKTRTERALFFTPPRLAGRVISNLIARGASLTDQHWHDPACGGAAFLVPIAQQMAMALSKLDVPPREQLRRIEANLSGNDLDGVLLDISSSFLEMALYQLIDETGYRPSFRLVRGDGLISTVADTLQPDVIACNPPYRKLKSEEVDRYRLQHGDVIEGQPNIYGLFINRTLQLARDGGLVGLLTPTSFLSGRSFAKLRTKLLTRSDTLQLDMLAGSMFIDVDQETAITILRTREFQTAVSAHTAVSVLGPEGKFDEIGEYLLPNSGRPWPIPRAVEDAELLRTAEAANFRLSDYGYIARVGHLVGYRDTRPRFDRLPPVGSKRTIVPLVWATDISPNGNFSHGREHRMGRTREYVEVQSLSAQGVVSKPVVLLQRLTSSDQRSRLVATDVPRDWIDRHGGFVCENHVIVVEPTSDESLSPELMAKILNSRPVDRVFRSISGASNVAVSELNEMPLPDPRVLHEKMAIYSSIDDAVRHAYQVALSELSQPLSISVR
ncbi:Eco57I restriction-modification methylase domain-containing protein [Caballeronia sp. 15711]|uniref:Eco57I restriction-modification methylase domain-containing protein n=1 Tax=Caballeronia sp. 15711 TaxID=3391029 RepID=UPI0039E21FCB